MSDRPFMTGRYFDPAELADDTIALIRWHLHDLIYKAPEVAHPRRFRDDAGRAIVVYPGGLVEVDGLICRQP